MASDPRVAVPTLCAHCRQALSPTAPELVEFARQVERSIPAVFRKLYFLARSDRKPSLLRSFDDLVAFLGAPGPPATTFLSLDREDSEIVRSGVGYLHNDPPSRVARKGS